SRDTPDRGRRTPLATAGCTKRQLSVFPRTAEPEHRPRELRTRQTQPCGQTSSQTPEFQVQRLRPPVQPPTTVHATVAVYLTCVNAGRVRMPPATSMNNPIAATTSPTLYTLPTSASGRTSPRNHSGVSAWARVVFW